MNFRNPELKQKAILISRREAEGSGWQVANLNNQEVCARLRQNNAF